MLSKVNIRRYSTIPDCSYVLGRVLLGDPSSTSGRKHHSNPAPDGDRGKQLKVGHDVVSGVSRSEVKVLLDH